ncbi:MAG: hypothetical protein A3I24_00420 [Candidatus Harrisonbacteria bacterium RIFCSPLOWO2_02_FULL_41_13b]|uniref:POTRA domain-containing protein n=1 Tax=Candidatus Harrisonbacteria bacterium RIFCSPLOWO2_02_FULL_41_13b TaxID=1798409 RepID=A0A1G1ZSN3_9BACT|nr:MAG: hypothetical protein A3J53_00635 [Candidatus Harrisonbacteria bacterium RIFCSPHIGHO2_02_FULL_40_20]OGY67564.1 MAG: hypothetical protein A3I24_00420 [Candidatus Harrisonbacteria bacterium RIFCSPLOWO2_02_FULL_41_13b]
MKFGIWGLEFNLFMDLYQSQNGNKQNSLWPRLKLYLFFGAIGLLMIGGLYALIFSQIFQVKVQISGLQRLTEDRFFHDFATAVFQNRLKGFLGFNNYFTWPSNIKLKNPLVASVDIDKRLLEKKILVKVEERQSYGIWCGGMPHPTSYISHSSCYWFDKGGVLFEEAPVPEGHLILRIDSDLETIPMLGELAVSAEFYANIDKIFKFFSETGLPIDSYVLKNDLQEFRAQVKDSPEIRFSLRFDVKNSLDALELLMQKGDWKKSNYVDLTVENRVYIQ